MRHAHRFYLGIATMLVMVTLAAFALAISQPSGSATAAARASTVARTHASVLSSLDDPLNRYRDASRGGRPIRLSCEADCRSSVN